MSSLESIFQKASQDGPIPGAVLIAANCSGIFHYAKAFGARSFKTKEPLELDTFMTIASCTKLLTSLAALQCIERGLLTLDADIAPILPEIAALEILVGFTDAGEPVLKKRGKTITLRHLLAHSSGLSYTITSPILDRYATHNNHARTPPHHITDLARQPLLFEPGTSWAYGTGLDWAGKAIERVTHTTLEVYMQTSIFQPLGIAAGEMTFWPAKHPEVRRRSADMALRDPATGAVVEMPGDFSLTAGAKDCFGGHGLSVVRPETAAVMFEPQLKEESGLAMNAKWAEPAEMGMIIGEFPQGGRVDWGIGGLLVGERGRGWRRGGTLLWSGMPNFFWFIDRKAGLCGLYGGQLMPPGDEKAGKMITLFEKAMYEMVGEKEREREMF